MCRGEMQSPKSANTFEICITKFEHVQEMLVAGKVPVLGGDDFQMQISEKSLQTISNFQRHSCRWHNYLHDDVNTLNYIDGTPHSFLKEFEIMSPSRMNKKCHATSRYVTCKLSAQKYVFWL